MAHLIGQRLLNLRYWEIQVFYWKRRHGNLWRLLLWKHQTITINVFSYKEVKQAYKNRVYQIHYFSKWGKISDSNLHIKVHNA